jgi:hypothetical protein
MIWAEIWLVVIAMQVASFTRNGAELENWFCPACDTLVDDDDIRLEQVESRPISGNNVEALLKAVELSFDEVPLKSFVRGFETRRVFIKKVLVSNDDNN